MHLLRIGFKYVQNNSATILKGCMGIVFLIGLLIPASTAFASTDSAHISQGTSIASDDDTTACADVSNQNLYIHCVAPTAKTYCSGPQYNGPVSDGKTMIDWTYTYGSKHCVTVTWNTANFLVNDKCHARMYIPVHNATANLTYQFNLGPNTSADSDTVHQSGYSDGAFVDLGLVQRTMKSITIQDNIGTLHGAKIGWGTKADHSLKITCDRGRA